MTRMLRSLWGDEGGATMVEYGLMLALIAMVCVAAVSILGVNASGFFTTFAGLMP